MHDLILRTQSEVIALKQRAVKLARMWEERKHSTGSPRADRALVLMEVARDAALAAGVIQEIKMALDAKEFVDLLVKFRFTETVDDEGAARDFLTRQPKEKVEEGAARFFNVFKATVGNYGGVFLDRSGRPLLVEGPRLVEFVKWFVEQLLLEKEADEGVRYFKGLEDGTIAPPKMYERHDARPASPLPSLIDAVKGVDISGVNIMGGELQPNGDLVVEVPEKLDLRKVDCLGALRALHGEKPLDEDVTPGGVYRRSPMDEAAGVTLETNKTFPDKPVTGTYVGVEYPHLKGEKAVIRVGAKGILAQFDNQDLDFSQGWHAFGPEDFVVDGEGEA